MWKDFKRPPWQTAQAERLEAGRAGLKRTVFRRGGVEDDEKEEARTFRAERDEPTATSSSSADVMIRRPLESHHPTTIAADLSEFRSRTMTPASFQPHRHVWFVTGRPVVVPQAAKSEFELIPLSRCFVHAWSWVHEPTACAIFS
jgi:hypothetical protein